jgi:hypothetical protein
MSKATDAIKGINPIDGLTKATLKEALPNWIETNASELITASVFEAMSTKLFSIQTGVTSEVAINLLDTAVKFGDGAECGFNNTVDQVISQRTIKPGYIKVNAEWCDKEFLDTFAHHLVKMAAGSEELPFEQWFVEDIIKHIGEELEKAIWQGEKKATPATNLDYFDGLLKIMDADVPAANKITLTGNDTFEQIWTVYSAIPSNLINDTVIYVGRETYRNLIKDMTFNQSRIALAYNYNEQMNKEMEMILPGTNTMVKAVNGLDDTKKIVACIPSHIFYGVDGVSDKETFKFWFSDDADQFRMKVAFSAGVQIARPEEVVLGTITE